MARIMIFTGKGGVGKTSIAAAHARQSANEGKKTLIVSTDMAHNLSDIFEVTLGREPVEAAKNLYALELDPTHIMEEDFQDISRGLVRMVESIGMKDTSIGDMAFLPGTDELFSLLKIKEINQKGDYERIIVDCAPTGETLALLKFPELMSWYMQKLFPLGKAAMRVLSPLSRPLLKVQLPDHKAMSDIEKIYVKLADLQEFLKDRTTTSIRLVAMAEKMVVEETKRNYMYMNLYDFHVDGLYINRILPEDMDNKFFSQWLAIQKNYMRELEAVFTDIPVYHVPWYDSDLNGLSGIDRIADGVLAGRDVFKIYENRSGEQYSKTDRGYRLTLFLPGVAKGDIKMHETETDIILKIGNFKRNIPKPSVLRKYGIVSAKMDRQTLTICFEPDNEET